MNNINNNKANLFFLDVESDKINFKIKNDFLFNDLSIVDSKTRNVFNFNDFNFIHLYKSKYSKEEIKEQQVILLLEFQKIMDGVKQLLVILTDSKLTMDIDDDQVNDVINAKIIQDSSLNVDTFFNDIGKRLAKIYKSNKFDKFDSSPDSPYKIALFKLYLFFVEDSSIDETREIFLGFVHAYTAFCNYWNIFKFLLKIKNKLNLFFSYLLSDTLIYDRGINLLFLQFEFFILIDIFYHNSFSHFNRYRRAHGIEHYKNTYVSFCKEHSCNLFDFYCPTKILLNTELVPNYDVGIMMALETNFQKKWNTKEGSYFFSESFSKEFQCSILALQSPDDINKFAFLYDDSMVDFRYILSFIISLNYTVVIAPIFFDLFISKYV